MKSRGRIVESVDVVWEHRQAITAAGVFVQDHADELIDLAKRLPVLPAAARPSARDRWRRGATGQCDQTQARHEAKDLLVNALRFWTPVTKS